MKISLKTIVSTISLLIILFFGYQLRTKYYQNIPFPGETMDEYSNTWVGLSLIRLGMPVGNSGLADGYPQTDYRYLNVDRVFQSTANGTPQSLNYPWFDHPPLLGLLTGSYAYSKGARVFEDCLISIIRRPMVYLSVVSLLLVFIYALLIFNLTTAFLAALIYTFSPYIVVSSRLVQAENALIPLFLSSLIFLNLYFRSKKPLFLWLAGLTSGASLLFKLTGIATTISGLSLIIFTNKKIFSEKTISEILLFGVVSCSFIFLFLIFGVSLNPSLFFKVLTANSNRIYGIGANAINNLIFQNKITNLKFLTDAWGITGWLSLISLFVLSVKKRQNQFLLIPTLVYLGIYLFFGSHPFGWYSFPFLPFITVATAYLIYQGLVNLNFSPYTLLLLLFPLGGTLSRVLSYPQFQSHASYWRLGVTLYLFFIIFLLIKPQKHALIVWFTRLLILITFSVSIFLSLKQFGQITPESWYQIT